MAQTADQQRQIARLREVLSRLAAASEKQAAYLQDLGFTTADELALELEDIAYAVDALVDAGVLTPDGAGLVGELEQQLASMSGSDNEALWTLEALRERPEWEAVRELAEHAHTTISGPAAAAD